MKSKHADAQYAYLAGMVDGEGCFSLYRTKSSGGGGTIRAYYWKAVLRVTNTEMSIMTWLVDTFGGCIGTHFNASQRTRPIHQWKASPNLMRTLLPGMLPFMVIKRRHAEITLEALRLIKLRVGGQYTCKDAIPRPFERELAILRNELVSINGFRHRTGTYAYLDDHATDPSLDDIQTPAEPIPAHQA